jgi:hypothetical protein
MKYHLIAVNLILRALKKKLFETIYKKMKKMQDQKNLSKAANK